MEMNIRHRIEEWVGEFISPYCSNCKDVCCDATKIIINIGKKEPAIELFRNAGLKVYKLSELDLPSVKSWSKNRLTGKVLTKDRTEVSQPSLIEAPTPERKGKKIKFSGKTDFVLYTEKHCPFYIEKRGCLAHGDPRRPQSCKEYPLTFETDGERSMISIHNSCYVMKSQEMKKQLRSYFPNFPVFFISEVLGNQILNSARKKFKIKGKR